MFIQFRKTARNVKDNRPKGFGKRVDVAEYVEKKTARNQNQNSVDMEAPPPRRQRERRQPQRVRDFQQVREVRQAPRKQRSKMQTPPPQYAKAPRQRYADLNATDEIIEYEERMPHQKWIIYSERESDLYEFDSYREPCRICGDYVHRDSSACSEKIVRIERL